MRIHRVLLVLGLASLAVPMFTFQRKAYAQSSPLSLDAFGCVGDGVTDDTGCFQAAVNAVPVGGTLAGTAGKTYRLTRELTVFNRNSVTLDGNHATVTTTGQNKFLHCSASSGIAIRDFNIKGTVPPASAAVAQGQITLEACSQVVIIGNIWRNTFAAVYFDQSSHVRISHNMIIDTVAGVQGSGSTDVIIGNNYFRGYIETPELYGSDDQIGAFAGTVADSNNIVISDNVVDKQGPTLKNQANCIIIGKGKADAVISNVVVKRNVCLNSASLLDDRTTSIVADAGILLVNGKNETLLKNISVVDNIIDTANAGIAIRGPADQIEIRDNTIHRTIGAQSMYYGQGIRFENIGNSRATIRGNRVSETDGIRVALFYMTQGIVSGNITEKCGDQGMHIENDSGLSIEDNRIVGSGGAGLFLADVTASTVERNVIAISGGLGLQVSGSNSQLVIQNNVIDGDINSGGSRKAMLLPGHGNGSRFACAPRLLLSIYRQPRASDTHSMIVTYLQRRPRLGVFSIERVFSTVRRALPSWVDCRVAVCRHNGTNPLRVFYNIVEATMRQAGINHITGDISYLALLLRKRSTILTVHDCESMVSLKGWRRRLYRWWWLSIPIQRSALVTVISERIKQEVMQYTGCPEAKIRVVPDPVGGSSSRFPGSSAGRCR